MLTAEQIEEARKDVEAQIDKVLRNLPEDMRMDWLKEYAINATIQKNMYKIVYDLNSKYLPDGITMKVNF
jgi:hypothetical protein